MVARICAKELKRVIQALKPFTSGGTYNKLMQYIHFKVNSQEKEVKFEALDGHRIAVEYLPCEADEDFKGYIMPVNIGKIRDDYCEIELQGDKSYLTVDDIRYRFIQPEGTWYNTDKIWKDFQKKEPQIVGMNTELLREALKYQETANSGRTNAQLEFRGEREAVIIRNCNDGRNMRAILPITLPRG
ncbi:MAG: hypothetical protein K0S61_4337 [Anaerocolumna sp.]|jgi:DNA polymerase III sliding clamp (beta) subunit (PCNA family)|nr:hypothetical protein [Anaerocolumna sp.]